MIAIMLLLTSFAMNLSAGCGVYSKLMDEFRPVAASGIHGAGVANEEDIVRGDAVDAHDYSPCRAMNASTR